MRCTFQDESGTEFEAWCACPEDIIVGRLMAWREGRLAKHPADIREMLVFALSGLSEGPLDLDYINLRTVRLGAEVAELWDGLKQRAQDDACQYRG